jgi:probable HAF family extracellular repeat protein
MFTSPSYLFKSALWSNGSWQNWARWGVIAVYGINNSGQVVGNADLTGSATAHAFLWPDPAEPTNPKMLDLGTLGGANSLARHINNAGQVVGQSAISGTTPTHAFLWSNGSIQDLGTLGGTNSYAYGSNDTGQVVGVSQASGSTAYRAALWTDGVVTDMNPFLPTGWTLPTLYAINNKGQIAGYGKYNTYNTAFILTQNLKVTAFTLPATAPSLAVPITEFTGTDPTGISGYMVTENAVAPSAGDAGWSTDPLTQFTFSGYGSKTAYAWAKDAAGNVSFGVSRAVNIAHAATVTLGSNLTSTYDGTVKVRHRNYGSHRSDVILLITVALMRQPPRAAIR